MAKLKIELDTDDYKSENELYESIIRGLQEAIEMNNDKNEKKSKRWEPKLGKYYYFVDSCNDVEEDVWTNDYYGTNERRFNARNVFRTKEEAEFEAERRKVIAELETFAEENDDGIDWHNFGMLKHRIIYDFCEKRVRLECDTYWQSDTIYFSSKDLAYQAVETVGEDRIKKYLFNVED